MLHMYQILVNLFTYRLLTIVHLFITLLFIIYELLIYLPACPVDIPRPECVVAFHSKT